MSLFAKGKQSTIEAVRNLFQQREIYQSLRGFPYWSAAVIVGFGAVLYSTAFSEAILFARSVVTNHPYIFLSTAPLFFILGSWIVERFAPDAGGTGVPRVISILSLDSVEGKTEIDRAVDLRVALVAILSSILCILGGGGLGREGPMVLIAACIFSFVGKRFHRIWPYGEHRSWIVAGGAAGLAAAFQTPLAGVIFVVEELAQVHFQTFKTYLISAVIISGMIAQWLFGRYLYLGYAHLDSVPFSCVPWAILLGIICGGCAGVFEWLVVSIRKHTSRLFGKRDSC